MSATWGVAADAYRLFPFADFDFSDAGFFEQFDEFLYFADIHAVSSLFFSYLRAGAAVWLRW